MDGYSVQEAASVLGVAEGRVWELLARGVLLGTPEGDSMRVFLKAQPGPIATAGAHEEPRTNGNGGSHGPAGEASAFRELLTEFRNLTERYGQALLALGEARGEVAGLRSRVDQLEARLDLRLPPPLEAAPVAWESATIPAAAPDFAPAAPPRAPRPEPARPKPRPRKVRSPREAVASFADALARAQDPSASELGQSRSEAAPETEASAEALTVDASTLEEPVEPASEPMLEAPAPEAAAEEIPVPDELFVTEPVVQAIPVADVAEAAEAPVPQAAEEEVTVESAAEPAEQPTYSAAVVEPDWFADGDFAWLDGADLEATAAEPTEAAAAAEPATAEPAEPAERAAEQPPEEQPQAQVAQEPEPIPEPLPPEPAPEPEPVPEFEAEADFESWQPPEAPPLGPAAAGPAGGPAAAAERDEAQERQAMSAPVAVEELEEEVMWLGAAPTPVAQDEPLQQPRAESTPWPALDSAPQVTDVRPPLAMTEDELARLALDEGWDEAEVAAIRAIITPLPSATVDLPGAAELHDAMAALEAVPVRADLRYDASRQWAKPAPEDQEPPRHDDWAFEAEPVPPPAAPPPAASPRTQTDVTSALRRSVADTSWLRRRQGPAAAAYRRLRRLFPG